MLSRSFEALSMVMRLIEWNLRNNTPLGVPGRNKPKTFLQKNSSASIAFSLKTPTVIDVRCGYPDFLHPLISSEHEAKFVTYLTFTDRSESRLLVVDQLAFTLMRPRMNA